MNKKLVFTLIFCLFASNLPAQAQNIPFYRNDAKMAQITGILFGLLVGVKYIADGLDHGYTQVISYNPTINRTTSGTFQIGSIKDYSVLNLRTLAGSVNDTIKAPMIIGAGLVCLWYIVKVIENKLSSHSSNDRVQQGGLT